MDALKQNNTYSKEQKKFKLNNLFTEIIKNICEKYIILKCNNLLIS